MSKILNTLIGVLILFAVVLLYIRKQENDDFNKQIETLEDLRRFNYIKIDSLITIKENLNEYIFDLETKNDSLDKVSELSKKKVKDYEKEIANFNSIFFNNASDSAIVGILSSVKFNP